MKSYLECQKILYEIAKTAAVRASEKVSLSSAIGRQLSQDLLAREDSPNFNNAAMDGFALNFESVNSIQNIEQTEFSVKATIAAGDINNSEFAEHFLDKNTAIEIMTGAPLPSHLFNTVIKVEDVDQRVDQRHGKVIKLKIKPKPGAHIRLKGSDCKKGQLLLERGFVLKSNHLPALASQGISEVEVYKRLSVGLIATGKELVPFEQELLQGAQVRNSTGLYLANRLQESACAVKDFSCIGDDQNLFLNTLRRGLEGGIELFISTGAVSMGLFDFVKSAIESLGATVHFHKSSIRPGKPILFASLLYEGKTRFFFGVPGNPVSTVVACQFFILPFVRSLMGLPQAVPLNAILTSTVLKPDGLRCFFKANLIFENNQYFVEILTGQGSYMVSPLLNANAWVVLPENATQVEKGSFVEVYPI